MNRSAFKKARAKRVDASIAPGRVPLVGLVGRLLRASLLLLPLTLGCSARSSTGRSAEPAAKPPALRVLPDRLDGRPFLSVLSTRASAAGAGPLRILGADVAAEGDRLGAFVEIPDGECFLALSRASSGSVDVDLFAYDDEGSAFAADESQGSEASLLVCPPHPRRLYVVARIVSGTSVVAVGVQSVPRAAAAAVSRAVGARGRPGEDSGRLDAWPGLEAKIRAHRKAIGGVWDDVRRVVLPVSPRAATRISLAVEPNRCFDVLVSPSDEIASLELLAEDDAARIIGRGQERGHERTLVLCSAAASSITLAIRPRMAEGLCALIIGRSSSGAAVEIAESARAVFITQPLALDGARLALERSLASLAYAPSKSLASGSARLGARVSVPLELPAGCARLDVIAGKPLADVAAVLWDDKGGLWAEGRGGASASLFPCGKGGPARLDLDALSQGGPYAVLLRTDRAAPPRLVAHPLAASRLLARMNAGSLPASSAAALDAMLVPLDPTSLRSFPLRVPPSTCVEVIAALDAGGLGLELRLAENAEGAVTRSRYVVADRLCAGAVPKTAAIELRLSSGKADALVLTRPAGSP